MNCCAPWLRSPRSTCHPHFSYFATRVSYSSVVICRKPDFCSSTRWCRTQPMDRLLRTERRDVHRRVGEALESRFSETTEIQPELLAHHFTEADMADHAVRYWLKAGQQALGQSGMVEAAALLRKGLSLILNVPDSVQRQEQELDLQIALGQAIIATQGYAAPEVSEAYARARELCEQLECAHKLLPILYGQWAFHSVANLVQAQQIRRGNPEFQRDARQYCCSRDELPREWPHTSDDWRLRGRT